MQSLNEKIMLPFSFCRYDEANPVLFLIDLNKKMKWLTFARMPYDYNLTKFFKEYLDNLELDEIIISSEIECSSNKKDETDFKNGSSQESMG